MNIMTETSSKWGNLYNIRFYLNGRRISKDKALQIFEKHKPEQISSERVPKFSGWRTKWRFK
jgi:hypothetical protein